MIVNDFIFALTGGFSFMWNYPKMFRQRWRECHEKRIYMPLFLITQLAFAYFMLVFALILFLLAWYGHGHRIPWGLRQFLVTMSDILPWYLYIGIPLLIVTYAWVSAISEPLWRDRSPSMFDDYSYEGSGAEANGFSKKQYLKEKYAIECWIHPEYSRNLPWNKDRLGHPDMPYEEFRDKWKDDFAFRMSEREFNNIYKELRRKYIRDNNP